MTMLKMTTMMRFNVQPEQPNTPAYIFYRWNGLKTWEQTPRRSIQIYRNELDLLQIDFVDWIPYGSLRELPRICTLDHQIWTSKTLLICFDEVQMYSLDRVMRQFGYKQHILDASVPYQLRCTKKVSKHSKVENQHS